MSRIKSPYDSITFENPLSLRVDSNYMSIMSISPCGKDAVLAGRKGLLVIDMDDPFAAPRWLRHETSWEVADVQWSPHRSKPSWVVSTSNQKAMVWNLARPSNDAIEYVLHSHSRAITDIHFHPQNPEMLATCSVDSFVCAWDLRCPKEPVQQWSDWKSAASQVKWNYKDPNIIASSHDNTIKIWDRRKGAIPMKNIKGHDAKINGLDWSRENKYELISSSNDMSVKFWSFDKEYEKPVYTIRTDFPVSKARHVPFGDHICGIMPLRGGDNSIYMVNYKDKVGESGLNASYKFKGHHGTVKDFVWRTRHTPNSDINDSEYQLVTWGSDKDLRLWPLNDEMYEIFDYKRNEPLPAGVKLPEFEYKSYRPEPEITGENKFIIRKKSLFLPVDRSDDSSRSDSDFNHLNWISGIRFGQSVFQNGDNDPNSINYGDNSNQPLNLGEEFSNIGQKFPKLRFERISVSTGVLVLSLNGPWSSENNDDLIFMRVEFNFPKGYPSVSAVPTFKIEETHELNGEKREEIIKQLEEIANKFCSNKRFCLEPCLRFLLGEKVDLDLELEESIDPYDLEYRDDKNNMLVDVSDLESTISNDDKEKNCEEDDDEEEEDDVDLELEDEKTNRVIVAQNNLKRAPFDSTPVSKGCGAIWTSSGHLVCFFISRETDTEQPIKFGQQGFSLVRSLKRKPVSSGLQLSKNNVIDGNLSDYDDSDSEQSDDSLSNDFEMFQTDRLYRTKVPNLLRNMNVNNIDSKQYSSNARSNPMSAPTERSHVTNTSKSHKSKNVVKIYDFRNLIPIKMELAYEYRVLGDDPYLLAEHNSIVAEKYGYTTISNCWKILSYILMKDVKLDAETTIDMLDKIGNEINDSNLVRNYRFYWGYHPFGSVWLVKNIFEYFQKVNNIQMLAMLSCILFENDVIRDHTHVPINSPYNSSKTQIEGQKSILRKNPSITSSQKNSSMSRGAFGSIGSQLIRNQSTVSFNKLNSTLMPASLSSNILQHRMPSISTLSSYEYDNRSFKSSSPAGDMMINNNLSNNNKSHNRRGIKHKGSNFAEFNGNLDKENNATSSLNSGVNLTLSSNSNMGYNQSSLQNSNAFNQQTNTINNVYIPPKLTRTVSTISRPKTPMRMYDRMLSEQMPVVNIEMKNTLELDLYESQYCTNIASFVNINNLKEYRAEYASILFYWGLPTNRIKILKFNYNTNSTDENENKKSDFQEHCGDIGWCDDCMLEEDDTPKEIWKKFHDKNKCTYCDLAVTKRLSVCTNCNHIMHDRCAVIWWEEDKMDQCPSGCGCMCMVRHI